MHYLFLSIIVFCICLQGYVFGEGGGLNVLYRQLPLKASAVSALGARDGLMGPNLGLPSTPATRGKFTARRSNSGGEYSVAHMSSQGLKQLHLAEGSVVLISGKKRSRAAAVVIVDDDVEGDSVVLHPEMFSNLRLNEHHVVTVTALGSGNLQQAHRAVLLPFTDDLVARGLSSGNNATTGSGSGSKATGDILFERFLQPYFKDNYFPVHKDNIIPIAERGVTADGAVPRKSLAGAGSIDFKVCSVLNDRDEEMRFGVVGPETELIFEGGELDRAAEDSRARDLADLSAAEGLTFSQIGGYGKQVLQLRELVELPLRFPELYSSLGLPSATGVLLCGPSGSGKTTMAKTLANELGAELITINGPELMSKMAGESEEKLRAAFADAGRRAPCILFIDELDSIAPKRDKASTGEVERRLVSQLVASMDELHSRQTSGRDTAGQKMHNVVVIGATQRPNGVDSALRRFGRFEKEVHLNVPDVAGRLEILKIKAAKMRLAGLGSGLNAGDATDAVDLGGLAKQTHGYTGSDLSQLCSEAGAALIQEEAGRLQMALDQDQKQDQGHAAPVITLNADGEETLSPEYLASLAVSDRHFKAAVKATHPSSLKESVVETPNVGWDDIGGLESTKQELYETIQYPIQHAELFERFGMRPSRGVLFYGPPGCGKTLMAKAVANECGANFISIKGPELLTMWFGESEANVRELFDKARAAAPCILFFDEIDSLAKARGSSTSGGSEAADRVINQILTEIDGLGANNKDIFIIGATNRPDVLDAAITRPGRLDQLIYIPLPDAPSRRSIFLANLRKTPLGDGVDVNVLVNQTEGFSGADITEVCQRAVKLAIREVILWNSTQSSGTAGTGAPADLMRLQQSHLLEALTYARKSVNSNDLLKYAEFANNMKLDLPPGLVPEVMSGGSKRPTGTDIVASDNSPAADSSADLSRLSSSVNDAMSGAFKAAEPSASTGHPESKRMSTEAMQAIMRRIEEQTREDQVF